MKPVKEYSPSFWPIFAYCAIGFRMLGLESNMPLYHIENGKNKFSIDMSKKIVSRYPEISVVYLLTGCGFLLERKKEIIYNNKVLEPMLSIWRLSGENYFLETFFRPCDSMNNTIANWKFNLGRM